MTHYWNIIKRNLLLVLLISSLGALLSFGIVSRQGLTYQVHFSYLVALQERDTVQEYRFDGYYAQQSTDLFSSTLAEWITTPEIVAATYEEAGIPLATSDANQLSKIVEANKSAPQLIEVTIKNKNRETAVKLAEALKVVVDSRIETYHAEGIPAVTFGVVPSEIWTGETKLAVPVVVSGVFIFTFMFSINILLLLVSLRRMKD